MSEPQSMLSHGDSAYSDPVLDCIDIATLRDTVQSFGFAADRMPPDALLQTYRTDPRVSSISPNPLFDEGWYLHSNQDVAKAVARGVFASGFLHFIDFGLFEGRWPSASMKAGMVERILPLRDAIDEDLYRAMHDAARDFLRRFPVATALIHYNRFGRFLGLHTDVPEPRDDAASRRERLHFEALSHDFDAEWYIRTYLSHDRGTRFRDDPFTHYLIHGMLEGNSPGPGFDEGFYRAFYPEIETAIARGEIPSGFYHYVVAGRDENRLPRYERKQVLEARIPGVTRPVLLERIPDIEARSRRPAVTVDPAAPPRLWVLLPTINPDITFGGYRSVLELIRRLHDTGRRVTVVCTEDGHASRNYFLWRESAEAFRKVFREIDVRGYSESLTLTVGADDTVIAYSVWDLYTADAIRGAAPRTRVVLLTQEFEPIFYDNSSARAVAEEAYRIPHFALINSEFLRRYLDRHKIGVFGADRPAVRGRDFDIFEHRINVLAAQDVGQIEARATRVLVTYARPEGHAARNLFEILILALRKVCAEGLFGPEWQFVGLGALTDIEAVPLSAQHKLKIHPKMTEDEYARYVDAMDIGISLMYAPHPSVVPFEFATTGALVVTNVFENRSATELAAISGNIIGGRPTVDGIADALREAIARVPDAATRVANIYRPGRTSWDEVFHDTLLDIVADDAREPAAARPANRPGHPPVRRRRETPRHSST